MATTKKTVRVVKEVKEVNVNEIEIGGVTLMIPDFDENSLTIGMLRKTRALDAEAQSLEMLFLVLEAYLPAEELAKWDNVKLSDLQDLANEKVTDLQKK